MSDDGTLVTDTTDFISQVRFRGTSFRMNLPNRDKDIIQKAIYERQRPYELEMVLDMVERAESGTVFVDVGANIGNHSLCMAAATDVSVYAFEPNATLVDALKVSIRANGMEDRVHAFAQALGAREEAGEFIPGTEVRIGMSRVVPGSGDVRISTLDSLDLPARVSVIKIDVEGMERPVLEGAREVISRDRPALYCEAKLRGEYEELREFMKSVDYMLVASFNVSPTHLFLPREASEDLSKVEKLRHLEILQVFRYRTQLGELSRKIREIEKVLAS